MSDMPRKLTKEESDGVRFSVRFMRTVGRDTDADNAVAALDRNAALEALLGEVAAKVEIDPPIEMEPLSYHGEASICSWCGETWSEDRLSLDDFAAGKQYKREHPANDCAYVRLRAAVEG